MIRKHVAVHDVAALDPVTAHEVGRVIAIPIEHGDLHRVPEQPAVPGLDFKADARHHKTDHLLAPRQQGVHPRRRIGRFQIEDVDLMAEAIELGAGHQQEAANGKIGAVGR